jgi:predicted phage terminase large subunit-like protein
MDELDLVLIRDLQERQEALSGMVKFREYMSRSGHFDFQHAPLPHHLLMIEGLDRCADLVGWTLDGRIPTRDELIAGCQKLAISAPPASAKSTYEYIQLPVMVLARWPKARILCISNTQLRAEEFNRRRRSAVDTDEFKKLSGVGLNPEAKGSQRFETSAGGFVLAAGAGTAISGVRADLIIMDDAVSGFEEANSMGQLEKLWQFYLTEARPRHDSPYTPEIIGGTRWSRFDPIGRALADEEGWESICLSLECDGEDDPLGREIGELLWPEKYAPELDDLKRDAMTFASLYQQKPLTSEGAFYDTKLMKPVKTVGPNMRRVIGMDLALSVGKGDFTVIMVCAIDHRGHVVIEHLWKDRVDIGESARKLSELCASFNVSQVLIDDDNASKVFVRYLHEQRIKTPVDLRPTRGNDKQTRAAPSRAMVQQGRIGYVQAPWTPDLLRELHEFPDSRHDDAVDCLSLVGRELYRTGHSSFKPEPPKSIEGAFIEESGIITTRSDLDSLWNSKRRVSRRI